MREKIFPYEQDPRRDHHGAPTDELVMDMRELAREAGVLPPPSFHHIHVFVRQPSCTSTAWWRQLSQRGDLKHDSRQLAQLRAQFSVTMA